MKKRLPALLAAFLITGFITLAMGAVSLNALFNPNSVAASDKAGAAAASSAPSSLQQAQIQQLQARIQEYQQREQQYQTQLQNDQQQIQRAGAEMEQFKQFILALQARGVIQIQPDGSVAITGRAED
jgi:peptidoglycan hydrolase CwlO-like protein